jgi:hypothetical protein
MAALQTAVEALQDTMSRQDSELRELREQNASHWRLPRRPSDWLPQPRRS